jgi:hypothetical protein
MSTDPTDPGAQPVPPDRSGGLPEPATPAMRLQIMSTEHWSLLASRALAWNESFSRASMFLSTLSFSIVALALVGQASGFGEEFRLFALVVLPVVLFLGIGTSLRMDHANHHDVMCVIGMNRIRAGYLELAPDLDRFFIMGSTDDIHGIQTTMGLYPGRGLVSNAFAANPTLIAVLNSVLVAAIAAVAVMQLGGEMMVSFAAGALGFVVAFAAWSWFARRLLTHVIADFEPRFPGAPEVPPMRPH